MRAPRLQLGERLGVDHAPRRIGHRRVQGDEIGAGQQFVERHPLNPEIDGALGRQERVVADHLHLEALRAVGDDRADIAAADNAKRLAAELDPHKARLLPLAGLGRAVGGGDLPRQREHHRNGVLGGGDGVAIGRVHHDDPALGGGRHVDIVDPDAGPADHLERARRSDQRRGHLGRRAHREPVIFTDCRAVGRQAARSALPRRCRARQRPRRRAGSARRRSGPSGIKAQRPCAASRSCSQAQSSQGSSASTSLRSTVAPVQMRMPGGEARWRRQIVADALGCRAGPASAARR